MEREVRGRAAWPAFFLNHIFASYFTTRFNILPVT